MPTLDDLPILASLTPTGDDLLPIYDLTGSGSSKVRKIAVDTISGLSSVQTATIPGSTATAFAVTAAAPLVALYGAFTGLSGIVTVTLPNPTGQLRDVAISSGFTSATGTPTLTVTSPTASTLFTFASASGVTSVSGYASNNIVRFRSNGTNWYRVH